MSHDPLPQTPEFPHVDYTTWRRRVEQELQGKDPAQELATRLVGGIEIQPLYTEQTGAVLDADPRIERKSRGWLVCQNYCLDSPDTETLAIGNDLENGVQGFSFSFDGDEHLEDRAVWVRNRLDEIFPAGGPLPELLLLDSTAAPSETAEAALSWSSSRQFDDGLRLGLGIDPLGQAVKAGRLSASTQRIAGQIQQGLDLVGDRTDPTRALTVSSRSYLAGGADASYQVALALATAVEYLRWLESVGVEPAKVADQIVFRFGIGRDFFAEIAKLRAFRSLWSSVARQCGADLEEEIWIHTDTSERILTGRDLPTNLLRATTGVLAAVLGGASSISCAAYDTTVGSPSTRGLRLARNTQHILREESHLDLVVDPSAGSYYVESLTSQIANRSWEVFRELEKQGGLLASLKAGSVQRALANLWYQRRQRFADRSDPITGISFFADPKEDSPAARANAAGDTSSDVPEQLQSDEEVWIALPKVESHRDSEDYETLRNQADRLADKLGHIPRAYLLPVPSFAQTRQVTTFARNLLSGGGLDIVVQDQVADWAPDQSSVLCICANTFEELEAAQSTFAGLEKRSRPIIIWATALQPSTDTVLPADVETILHPDVDAVEVLTQLLASLANRLQGGH